MQKTFYYALFVKKLKAIIFYYFKIILEIVFFFNLTSLIKINLGDYNFDNTKY